jgi:hypothetical protein
MDLLGDVGPMEANSSPFEDSVNLHKRLVHSLRRTCNNLKNCFGHTQWNSMVMWVKWKLISVSFEIVLISTQDRFMVCIGHAIDSVIILGAPDGTPKRCGSSGRSLRFSWRRCQSRRDRCKVGTECTMGMEIILGIPNRISRLRGSNGSSLWSVWRFC